MEIVIKNKNELSFFKKGIRFNILNNLIFYLKLSIFRFILLLNVSFEELTFFVHLQVEIEFT